jgi:hypothetical protein
MHDTCKVVRSKAGLLRRMVRPAALALCRSTRVLTDSWVTRSPDTTSMSDPTSIPWIDLGNRTHLIIFRLPTFHTKTVICK